MKVELKIDHYNIKLFIDGVIHLFIVRYDFAGFQAWSDKNNMYVIEYYTKKTLIRTEWDSREKWLSILKELNEKL